MGVCHYVISAVVKQRVIEFGSGGEFLHPKSNVQKQLLHLLAIGIDGIHVDALAVAYDHAQWQSEFSANWPGGSAAHLSYHQRIAGGPSYGINQAMRQGIRISTPLRKQLLATGGIPS